MESRDESKDYELFGILKTIQLQLDKATIKKELAKMGQAVKLFHPKDNLRKELKKNMNSLQSIFNAFDRVDHNELQKDLEEISSRVTEIFEMFKLSTGIHNNVKVKAKKMKITSLADLDKLKDLVFEVDTTEEKGSAVNFLSHMTEQCANKLDNGDDVVFLNIPLIMNAYSENMDKLPRLGILVQNSKYGTLWSNQYIVAIKKDKNPTLEEVKKIIYKEYNEGFDFLFSPLRHKTFPDYLFYWGIPKRVMTELVYLKVYGYSLPFELRVKDKEISKERVKELREMRLAREAEKKKGKKDEF